MPVDALIALLPPASVNTVTTFNGAAFTLAGGTPRRGLKARVLLTVGTSSTTNTVQFQIDVAYDTVPTWNLALFESPIIALTTTSGPLELFIPFDISPQVTAGVINPPQIRLTCVTAGAGVPAVTYAGDLTIARP